MTQLLIPRVVPHLGAARSAPHALATRPAPAATAGWCWGDHPDALSSRIELVMGRYAQLVRRIGLRCGLGDTELEEVMQDVRVRLWRAWIATGVGAANTSYIYRVASSATMDLLRRRRARQWEQPYPAGCPEAIWSAPAAQSPCGTVESEEAVRQIERVIDTLQANRRLAVRMHVHGYAREEICRLLGWSEAKTRNLLYRGLADLRGKLLAAGLGPART